MHRTLDFQVLVALTLAAAGAGCAGGAADPAAPDQPTLPHTFDERPVVTARTPPPALSGGTLMTVGSLAVMSDPDRDRISIVDVAARALVVNLALEPGDEPGRLVDDAAGRVHVVLRRAGAVATLDIAQAEMIRRTPVCAAPRGIAFDAAQDELLIACASGELVRLAADGGTPRVIARLGTDLRDVTVVNGQVLVTRFRSAEVLRVDETSGETVASKPAQSRVAFPEPSTGALRVDTMSAQLAYRMRSAGSQLLLLAQTERDGEIELAPNARESVPQAAPMPVFRASPYGGVQAEFTAGRPTLSCAGVVQATLSHVDADGRVRVTRRIPGVLAIDAAQAPSMNWIAVAQAGAREPGTMQPPSQLLLFPGNLADVSPSAADVSCLPPSQLLMPGGEITAVAFAPNGELLAQSREPAFLAVMAPINSVDSPFGALINIALVGESVSDTGHALFHRDVGGGIACASCHAEGGDDGHVWHVSGTEPHRTQSLHVGLAASAPFHWNGDERDFTALVQDVMVQRMGGPEPSQARIAALEQWLYALQPPPPLRAANDPSAQRGKLLFEGDAQCILCHNGPRLSNNQTRAVGKGRELQVPSLHGIAYRKPLMHDGCASDLRARFDPACGGGDRHGKTSQLSERQLQDLIAYLETL